VKRATVEREAGFGGGVARIRKPLALASLACMGTATTSQWICESCGWIYDPAEGDPDGGIPAGTPFESIPDDWFCPVCGARKVDFEPYEG